LLASHAAVLSKNGLTAVVPGSSGNGKSTLALALMQRGWAYTSDEAFAMDRTTGEIHHYARPVAIADWPRRTLGLTDRGRSSAGETYLAAPDIGAAYELQPGAPGLLVLRCRDRGATSIQTVHRMDGLEALLRRSFTMHVDPGMALRMLSDVIRRCDVVRLSGGNPDEAAARIDALVD
jgi:hypothetical protein